MTLSLSRLFASLVAIAAVLPAFAAAAGSAADRTAFAAAYQAARLAPSGAWQVLARDLTDYPLYPYLEWAALTRDLARADPKDVAAFIARHGDTPLTSDLRSRWLERLAAQMRWREFLALYQTSESIELRCAHTTARIALADTAQLLADAKALWLTGRSLPAQCDPLVAWLKAQRGFDADLLWQRIRLAAAAREVALLRHLAAQLGTAQRAEAERWATTIANPGVELAQAPAWSDTGRHRELTVLATAQLARHDSVRAAQLWPALAKHYAYTDAERAVALNAIALQKGASYEPDAARWFAQVPPAMTDDTVRELRVREALARADHAAALVGLDLLTDAQKLDPRWRYVRARMLDETGARDAARGLFEALAREANYHGFLAADRLATPYAICPLDVEPSPAARAAIAREPGLVRAFELHAIGWQTEARREWNHALRDADSETRRAAVAAAHARAWTDRGPLTLLKPEDQRWYALRFPLAHEKTVRSAARRVGLDPALVLAIIRSESAWLSDAHSSADARGLMQLLPAVGAQVATRWKIPYHGVTDLYRPRVNIMLGTRHLADETARYGGHFWLAVAAYNAGPSPVARWRTARPGLPPDLWVETIPYKETREYIARVLAFGVIYDWRLNGDATPISSRFKASSPTAARRPVACPAGSGV